MSIVKSMLTVKQVEEAVKEKILEAGFDPSVVKVIPHEFVHNGSIVPYVSCGSYKVVKPDGFGGLDRMGVGECAYNIESNTFRDSTSSSATERRFTNVSDILFSVSNINSIARSRNVEPEDLLDVYTDYAVEDLYWANNHKE